MHDLELWVRWLLTPAPLVLGALKFPALAWPL